MRGDTPGVKFFYAAKLIRLEARGISYYILDGTCPPVTQLTKAGAERGTTSGGFSDWVRVEVTGGVLRAEDFRRRCFTFDVALRYRFA
jgi:hypothetical protein